MTESPLRRIVAVLLVYLAVTWVVLLGAGWLRRALALPELFDVLLRGGLVLGLPLAALMAWKYPEIGHGGQGPDERTFPREHDR